MIPGALGPWCFYTIHLLCGLGYKAWDAVTMFPPRWSLSSDPVCEVSGSVGADIPYNQVAITGHSKEARKKQAFNKSTHSDAERTLAWAPGI